MATMQWRNTVSRYGFVAIALHWIIAAGIIAQYFLAEAAEDHEVANGGTLSAADVHTSIGITILGLALIRVFWRLIEPPPARPPSMKSYEIALARAAHLAFYGLLFALPLSGWALTTAESEPVRYFGLFELPQLRIVGGEVREEQLEEVHEVLFNVLVGLAVLHVVAALKHHFFDRDNVLRSMLPPTSRSRSGTPPR
jgi:cytochrome b561